MTGPATAIATDLTEGVIDRFRSLPATRTAYLLGHYTAELAGMALSIVVLLTAGLLVGWRTHSDPLSVLAALVLLLCFASAMIWVGTWIGLMVRSPDAVMGVAFVVIFRSRSSATPSSRSEPSPTRCSGSHRGTRSAPWWRPRASSSATPRHPAPR